MKREEKFPAMDANEEIPALIETLLATEQRLEELTGGEVDTVAGRDGRTFLLRRAQEQLRYSEAVKQARDEESLRASQANMAAAQRLAHLGSWELELTNSKDVDANALRWSDEMFRIAGFEPGAVAVSNELFFRLVHPDDREPIRQCVAKAIYERREYSIVHRLVRPDGETRVVQETAQIFFDETTGQPAKIVGTAHDITERQQAEESSRRLVSIVESSNDAIIGETLEGIVTSWNRGAETIFGYTAAEMIGHSVAVLLPPGNATEERVILDRIVGTEETYHLETRRMRKDGVQIDVAATISPIRDADGKIVGASKIGRDITERKRSEQVIERGLQRLTEAQRIGQIGDWEYDLATQAITWSPQVFEIFGRDPRLGAPRNYEENTALFDAASQAVQTEKVTLAIESGEAQDYELRAHRSNGTPVDVLGRAVPRKDESGKVVGLVGTVQDITERKRMEEALRESEEHFRFLNDLAEATRPLAEPGQIMAAMARMLGEHLRASRCAYADVANDGEQFTILHDYTDGCASTVGNYQLSLFGARAVATLHNGQTLIIRDVNAELPPGEGADTFNAIGIQAIITCPLVKGGSLRALMAVHQTTPRNWKPGEVALVQDVVERCWATIERRTAEVEVQQSQKRLRDIFDGLGPAMFVGLLTPQGILIEVNQSPLTAAGLKPDDVLGKPFDEARWWSHSPEAQRQLREAIARAARGESSRYDVRVQGVGEQVIDVDFSLQPLRNEAGEVVFLVPSACVITERKLSEAALEKTHKELVKASRQAGMAEVATGILHNVGNVLNSVNIASACVAESIRKSKSVNLSKVVTLLREHEADLGAFFTVNPQGKQIPGYLAQLAEHLVGEQTAALKELAHLQKNIEHIKDIVAMQQGFAKVSGATERLAVTDLVEDALKMNASALARHDILVRREFQEVPLVTVEKHQVLQILVNLVRNAMQACDEAHPLAKQITLRVTRGKEGVRIAVTDNGTGISAENLTRIFAHGFTTKPSGHGFGLHSAALAAKKMGGALTVQSDGPGQGAAFTLELPIEPKGASHE